MSKDTIALAAQEALRRLGGRASLKDIYHKILQDDLFTFDTPTPEHVLDTEIKRRLFNSPRTDTRGPILFTMNEDQSYELSGDKPSKTKAKVKGPKRIMRSKDKSEIIEELMHESIGVFRENWRLLLFAAQVGAKNGRREPLKSPDSGSAIRQDIFGNCNAWPGILYLLSVAETEDASLLSGDNDGDNQRITLFEEYANGGLTVLQEYFKSTPLNTDSLLTYIEVNTAAPDQSIKGEIDLTI